MIIRKTKHSFSKQENSTDRIKRLHDRIDELEKTNRHLQQEVDFYKNRANKFDDTMSLLIASVTGAHKVEEDYKRALNELLNMRSQFVSQYQELISTIKKK